MDKVLYVGLPSEKDRAAILNTITKVANSAFILHALAKNNHFLVCIFTIFFHLCLCLQWAYSESLFQRVRSLAWLPLLTQCYYRIIYLHTSIISRSRILFQCSQIHDSYYHTRYKIVGCAFMHLFLSAASFLWSTSLFIIQRTASLSSNNSFPFSNDSSCS